VFDEAPCERLPIRAGVMQEGGGQGEETKRKKAEVSKKRMTGIQEVIGGAVDKTAESR